MGRQTRALFRLAYNYYLDPARYQADVDHYQIKDHEFVSLITALENNQAHAQLLRDMAASFDTDVENLRASVVGFMRRYLVNASHNYYQALGLPNAASIELIREQYRRLIRIFHPDKNTCDDNIALSINEAYNVLKNPERRSDYDKRIQENLPPATVAYTYRFRGPRQSGLNRPLTDYLYFLPGFQAHPRIYIWSCVAIMAFVVAVLPHRSGQIIESPSFAYTPSPAVARDAPAKFTDGLSGVSIEASSVATLLNSPELDRLLAGSTSGEQLNTDHNDSVVKLDMVAEPRAITNLSAAAKEDSVAQVSPEPVIVESPPLKPQLPISDRVAGKVIVDRLLPESDYQTAMAEGSPDTDDLVAGEKTKATDPDQITVSVVESSSVVFKPDRKNEAFIANQLSDRLHQDSAQRGNAGDGIIAVKTDDITQEMDAQDLQLAHAKEPGEKNRQVNIMRSVNYTSQYISTIQLAAYSVDQVGSENEHATGAVVSPPEIIFMKYISQYEAGDIREISRALPEQMLARNGLGREYIESAYRELFENTSSRNIVINELTISQMGASGNLLVSDIVLHAQFNNEATPRQYEGILTLRITNNLGGHEIAEINYDLN